MPLILGDIFGRTRLGAIFGLNTLAHGLIGGWGPLIWAKSSEIFGTYNVACLVSAICFAGAALAVSLVRPLKSRVAVHSDEAGTRTL